jgi:putative polymerase
LHIGAVISDRLTLQNSLPAEGQDKLANAAVIGQADRSSPAPRWTAGAIIVAAISFNAVLCFLNTRGVAISNFSVMMSEALLITAALVAGRQYLNTAHVSILALIVIFTAALSALRFANSPLEGFDPKISRDLFIPICFFLLGKAVNDLKTADKIIYVATAIALLFAVFEYFFLDTFLKVFGILEYYVARGTLQSSDSALSISQGLLFSGTRPTEQGRTLLSFLGEHRVSSIFLEPISLGNFAALVSLWAVVRSQMEGRFYLWLTLGGLALLILSDGRFDACFLVLGAAILMIPPRITSLFVIPLPFIVVLALYFFGAWADQYDKGVLAIDGFGTYDRILYCARILFNFDAYNWLGVEASPWPTPDAGYAYVISNIGIIGMAALWILFMSVEGSNRYYFALRNATAVFFAGLLCISSSPFTIKVAALLWFLLGVLSVARGYDRIHQPGRAVATRRPDHVPSLSGSIP